MPSFWAGPAWTQTADFAEAVDRYRAAARIPQTAYGAMEQFRQNWERQQQEQFRMEQRLRPPC